MERNGLGTGEYRSKIEYRVKRLECASAERHSREKEREEREKRMKEE